MLLLSPLLLATVARGIPHLQWKRQFVLTPSVDPFYTMPPAGWQTKAPGTILNYRTAPGSLIGLSYQAAYQLLYRTTDSVGNPTHAVTTVIIPSGADFSKLLSYQIFYDSADVDCSPSYQLIAGVNFDNGLNLGLGQGWVINTPDYEGPTAAFTAGVISGQATLDSIRAALSSTSITGLQPAARTTLWGYSGGALASEWAAELQPSYAPELKLAGAALGGLTPDVRTVALTINSGPYAGLIPAGILGLASQYQNLSDYVNQQVYPQYKYDLYQARNRCLAQQIASTAGTNYSTYTPGGLAVLDQPIPKSVILAGGKMGLHGTPQVPLYIYKGTGDEISPVNDTDALVKKYCAAGVKINYQRDIGNSHLTEAITGQSAALSYIEGIMNGGSGSSNCGLVPFV